MRELVFGRSLSTRVALGQCLGSAAQNNIACGAAMGVEGVGGTGANEPLLAGLGEVVGGGSGQFGDY